MWLAFGLGVFFGVMAGFVVAGLLTAGKLDDAVNGRDTPN
jgi:hypothetical protein